MAKSGRPRALDEDALSVHVNLNLKRSDWEAVERIAKHFDCHTSEAIRRVIRMAAGITRRKNVSNVQQEQEQPDEDRVGAAPEAGGLEGGDGDDGDDALRATADAEAAVGSDGDPEPATRDDSEHDPSAYCTFSDGADVYVFPRGGQLVCCDCSLLGGRRDFECRNAYAMMVHLKRHLALGQFIPLDALKRLQDERDAAYGKA